jgi:hypothetical protein
MPTAQEILQDPNYVNANAATKKAIFDKHIAGTPDYSQANPATQAAIQKRFGLAAPAPKSEIPQRSLLETGVEAVQNVPASAVKFGYGLASAALNPAETLNTTISAAAGGTKLAAEKVLPKKAYDFLVSLEKKPENVERAVANARAIGGVYADRYGSYDRVKNTIATDPVGAAADLSLVLSGGAGVAKTAAKASVKLAPAASARLTQASNLAGRGAQIANPINTLAPAGRAVVKLIEKTPRNAMMFKNPKAAAYLDAAEGRPNQLAAQLRSPDVELVPGSQPTAAQAAAPMGATKFSALGESAAKVMPSEYLQRAELQDAARVASLRKVGQTPAAIKAAEGARTAATQPLYTSAEARKFAADPKLLQLADDPYVREALPDALKLSKSQGVTFDSNPTKFLHNVKISLDKMLGRTGDTALARTERAQATAVRQQLIEWLEKKAPEYGQARTTFAEKSKPINQMQVGQYLESKLTSALGDDIGLRANSYAGAVRDAPGTIKRATTSNARYEKLTEVLEPAQVKIVENIRKDLERAAKTSQQAQRARGASPRANQLTKAATSELRLPNLLNRVTAVANDIWRRLQGKIDQKLAIELATEMLDPSKAATAIEAATAKEVAAIARGASAAKGARTAGAALKSKTALAGAQVQNAMADAENRNAMAR